MPLAWAFQRESELLPIFNYYLDKMQQTGIIHRLQQKFIGDHNRDTDASMIQDINGLGYANVAFPFLALLSGICLALLQLGIETAVICRKKCSNDEHQSNEDYSTSEEAQDIIGDINNLLLENYCELGGIKFLSKIRMLSTLQEAHP